MVHDFSFTDDFINVLKEIITLYKYLEVEEHFVYLLHYIQFWRLLSNMN